MSLQSQIDAVATVKGLSAPALLLGTKVLTMEGEFPVEYLTPGDRIVTRSGSRKLVAVKPHLVAKLAMIRIMEGVLGCESPEGDLCVTPAQPILIRDWRAKALYGSDAAMIPAGDLVDGEFIRREVMFQARVFTLHFEEEVVIYAGALELSCPATSVSA
ncbi:MAG: Hint domain-containing protein [Cypionkella sp.]|jgi:hypothetical protein